MADERTASTVTWLNSALRSSQESSTMVGQVQIRQWALMGPERKPPQKPTVKFRDLDKALLDVDIDSHSRERKHDDTQTSQSFVVDMDPTSDDDGWLDKHDPEVEQDLLYKSSDDQTLTVANDVHLNAPQLLDLLSHKLIAGGLKAPLEKEATVPLPSSGPVQWALSLRSNMLE
ncbi:hypothetical protein AZE42_13567 [Rhizopogon vesiculosus]|uniref:Uncharacterized protein n=1 Tax=Rhizopogon vesiculosus TaxID=180088 RepID=A0A1J8PMY1_9AGAM|nr:hypothetical protein AZE42_13567 [Rhizopogon vesiculosus]